MKKKSSIFKISPVVIVHAMVQFSSCFLLIFFQSPPPPPYQYGRVLQSQRCLHFPPRRQHPFQTDKTITQRACSEGGWGENQKYMVTPALPHCIPSSYPPSLPPSPPARAVREREGTRARCVNYKQRCGCVLHTSTPGEGG